MHYKVVLDMAAKESFLSSFNVVCRLTICCIFYIRDVLIFIIILCSSVEWIVAVLYNLYMSLETDHISQTETDHKLTIRCLTLSTQQAAKATGLSYGRI